MSYIISEIQTALFNEVTFRNTLDTDEYPLDTSVFGTPESGQYYNDSFALLELNNLKYIAPFQEGFNYPVYSSSSIYNTGDVVKDNNDEEIFYTSLTDANQGNPLSDTNNWERTYPFSQWLEKKVRNNVINPLFNEVFLKKKLNQTSKSVLTDLNLFEGVGNLYNTIPKEGRFVGMKWQFNSHQNLKLFINRISLQFSGSESFNIYVYHSSQLEPIQVVPVTYTKGNGSSEWIVLDEEIMLEFDSDDYNSGGYFYIGYYENDITSSAIRYNYNWNGACKACGGNAARWRRHYEQYSRYMYVNPFLVLNSNLQGTDLWNIDFDNLTKNQNWGLNFSFRIECDITNFIIKNKSVFTNALIQKAKNWVCEEIVNSDRDTEFTNKMKSQALYNLSSEGLNFPQMLQNEIDGINFDLSDLGSPCCPKQTKRGVTYKNI